MAVNKVADVLSQLGFNQLEAEVYRFLISESPSTGYRVSQGISKPTANVYKALESLLKKGAVLQNDSRKKSYVPIDPQKLIARFEKQFAADKSVALKQLAMAMLPAEPAAIVLTQTEEQLLSFATRALDDYDSAVAICSPYYAELLKEHFTGAFVMSSSPTLAKNHVMVPEEAFDTEMLQIVADRKVAVFASGAGASLSGFAVENEAFAAQLHQSIVCQIGLYQVDQAIEADMGRKQISRIIENLP